MQPTETVKLYEIGRRGKPVAGIRSGDLADPYEKSLWNRAVSLWNDVVDVARETRALEARLLGKSHYRHLGEY